MIFMPLLLFLVILLGFGSGLLFFFGGGGWNLFCFGGFCFVVALFCFVLLYFF